MTLVLAAAAIYVVISLLLGKVSVLADDLRYGRPRTTQIDAFVGHEETAGLPTHLMAINLNRQVMVIELPGGEAAKTRTLSGPYLFGANEELTPLQLHLQDLDGDGKPDLLLDIRQEQLGVFESRWSVSPANAGGAGGATAWERAMSAGRAPRQRKKPDLEPRTPLFEVRDNVLPRPPRPIETILGDWAIYRIASAARHVVRCLSYVPPSWNSSPLTSKQIIRHLSRTRLCRNIIRRRRLQRGQHATSCGPPMCRAQNSIAPCATRLPSYESYPQWEAPIARGAWPAARAAAVGGARVRFTDLDVSAKPQDFY